MCLLQRTCRNISTTINRNTSSDLKGSSQSPALCSAEGRRHREGHRSAAHGTALLQLHQSLPPLHLQIMETPTHCHHQPSGLQWSRRKRLKLYKEKLPAGLLLTPSCSSSISLSSTNCFYILLYKMSFSSQRLEHLIGMMTGFHNTRFWRLVLNLTL